MVSVDVKRHVYLLSLQSGGEKKGFIIIKLAVLFAYLPACTLAHTHTSTMKRVLLKKIQGVLMP